MNEAERTDANREKKTAYLKEAMRLVELGMEEHYITNIALERKAALLITFCTAVIGYLATAEFYIPQIYGISENTGKVILLTLKIAGIIYLARAAVYSMDILKLSPFIARGSNPEAVLDPYYGHSCNKFAEFYLNFSKEGFQENINAIEKKEERLKASYYLLIAGLALSLVLILIHQFAGVLSQ